MEANEDPVDRSFIAVNNATASTNLIHSSDGAANHGLRGAVVPAGALLCHILDFAREGAGFPRTRLGALIRFLEPVFDGERVGLTLVDEDEPVRIELRRMDGTTLATASFTNDPDLEANLNDYEPWPGDPRELTTDGLSSDRRLAPLRITCERNEIEASLHSAGVDRTFDVVPIAYLISQFVPFLRRNFVRRGPSLYAKAAVGARLPVRPGEGLCMRGKINDVYRRRGRGLVDIDTAWFNDEDREVLFVRHTLVYDLSGQ